jgi:hypothetical protein
MASFISQAFYTGEIDLSTNSTGGRVALQPVCVLWRRKRLLLLGVESRPSKPYTVTTSTELSRLREDVLLS